MFGNLKSHNDRESVFKNSPSMKHPFSRLPGALSSVTEHNEGDRLVRCRVCGWICARDRDTRIKDGKFAGLGINHGVQKVAGSSKGDVMGVGFGSTPFGASVYGVDVGAALRPDFYYDRDVQGGCPSCASYLYDEVPAPIPPLQ